MRSARRSTIRLRLTLWYASAFFVAGAVLIGLLYLLLQQSLDHSPGDAMVNMVQRFLSERGLRSRTPVIDGLLGAITQQAEQQRQDTLQSMFWWSMVSLGGATGVAACGVGWLLAGRALRPLQDITATARRVADHSLHERIGMAGPRDEIKDLPIRSMRCWNGWTGHSTGNADSWPTRPMSCGHRWRSTGRCWKSHSMILRCRTR